jgi:hypothetical protein
VQQAYRISGNGNTDWLFPFVDGAPPIGWAAAAPYLVLPLLLVLAQYASSAIISPIDPNQENATMQKVLVYALPWSLSWIALSVPSGLTLYYFSNTVFTTLSQVRARTPRGALSFVHETWQYRAEGCVSWALRSVAEVLVGVRLRPWDSHAANVLQWQLLENLESVCMVVTGAPRRLQIYFRKLGGATVKTPDLGPVKKLGMGRRSGPLVTPPKAASALPAFGGGADGLTAEFGAAMPSASPSGAAGADATAPAADGAAATAMAASDAPAEANRAAGTSNGTNGAASVEAGGGEQGQGIVGGLDVDKSQMDGVAEEELAFLERRCKRLRQPVTS